MASKIQIINRALSRLAQARITALSDDTQAAKLANAIYEDVAEEVMSEGAWTSCIRRATLAQLATTPTWGFDYQYQLPTDPKCLRVLEINEGRAGGTEFTIEGSKLLTDATSVDILYIAYITDSESYDVDLKQAIIWALVSEMAYTFAGSSAVALKLGQTAEAKYHELLAKNNMQGSNKELSSDTFIDPRFDI